MERAHTHGSRSMSAQHEHDDFGGLHRDLVHTGAAMDRRQLLRVAARYGVGMGALQLLGAQTPGR